MRGEAKTDGAWKHKGPRLENVDESTAGAFNAFGRMMHANRLLMNRMTAQSRTHHGEIVALALLSNREGLNQKELGKTLHLSPSRVSAIVDSLVSAGAVERRTDESDRRQARLHITAEGRRREKELRDLLGEQVNRTIGALSEPDRRELGRLLNELADKTLALVEEDSMDKGDTEGGLQA